MKKKEFEHLLQTCCEQLTLEARKNGFKSSKQFEDRVRQVISNLTERDPSIQIDFNSPVQAFPDIAVGEYGVEVKFTLKDTWRSVANSVLESQRVDSVKHIYIVFGKMGGVPEVKWRDYESSVIHVRTSHVPRFEVEMVPDDGKVLHQSLFTQMGIRYDKFRRLDMHEKMKYIRSYAKKIHPNERLWWIDDSDDEPHTIPLSARLYTNLTSAEKTIMRAEAALVCPKICKSGRDRTKYDDVVLYLMTYHGVLCHQARDLFSAGSVANSSSHEKGGIYIQKALKLIEKPMEEAALRMDDEIFVEYWGECVKPEDRIAHWLVLADRYATNWKPSDCLFLDYQAKRKKN